MRSILPVLFLVIAMLTMVTTMHWIASNEKVQIGTLKALGFRDRRILRHYTSYGFVIGLSGTLIGVALGYGIAAMVMSPNGMMSTYFDLPEWRLVLLAAAGADRPAAHTDQLSVRPTDAERHRRRAAALRIEGHEKSAFEHLPFWESLPFGTNWNFRDIMRHKSRSAMTLTGVTGCMVLLVGGLGMKDTMTEYLRVLDEDINNYATRINLSDTAPNSEAVSLAKQVNGDWMASCGVSYQGEAVTLEVYSAQQGKIRFVDEKHSLLELSDDDVYLCQRLRDTAEIGDVIEFSPYGSGETYRVRVAGYLRSVMTVSIVMTASFADDLGLPYQITAVFTDEKAGDIETSPISSGKQAKQAMMDSYYSFMEIMDFMVLIFVIAAIILGVIVLYNLGTMSYLERSRELATLKVLGFRDRHIGRLLVSQNFWLTEPAF